MPTESIQVSARFPVTPDQLFRAWLDSTEHTRFTGGRARIDPSVGGRFSAWDDFITGRTLEIEPGRRVVQAWRTVEFPLDAPDSRLEARFEPEQGGTRLVLVHQGLPQGHGDRYEEGWVDSYFEPMQRYFRRVLAIAGAAAARRASTASPARKPRASKAAKRKVKRVVKKVRAAASRTRVVKKVVRAKKKLVRKTAGRKIVRAAARRKVTRKAVRRKVRATARTRARR